MAFAIGLPSALLSMHGLQLLRVKSSAAHNLAMISSEEATADPYGMTNKRTDNSNSNGGCNFNCNCNCNCNADPTG